MYRKVVVSLILLLVFAVNADAGVKLGPKFGVSSAENSTDIYGDAETSRITGFVIGQFAQIELGHNSNIVLQPEIYFVRKGWNSDIEPSVTSTIKMDYFEMPFLVKYRLPVRGVVTPSIMVGPAFSILVGSKQEIEIDNSHNTYDMSYLSEDVDFSFVLGAGVDIDLNQAGVLVLDLRLVLSPITSFALPDVAPEGKNSAFMVQGGWGFNL